MEQFRLKANFDMPKIDRVETVFDLRRWFDRSKPGDSVVYLEGYLPIDRDEKHPLTLEYTARAKAISNLATEALECALRNELHLVQKRLGFMQYEYRAIRTSPRHMAYFERFQKKSFSAQEAERGRYKYQPKDTA